MMHSLFGVLLPTEYVSNKYETTNFEKYLIVFMHIHTGISITMILFILGRSRSQCGRLITWASKEISKAGKALSILDISPEYLEATCLQQYKDEGLEKCCVLPGARWKGFYGTYNKKQHFIYQGFSFR